MKKMHFFFKRETFWHPSTLVVIHLGKSLNINNGNKTQTNINECHKFGHAIQWLENF